MLTDVAALLLLLWAGLLAYGSLPTLLGDDPLWDDGVSVLGAVLAAAHLVAALGVLRRARWGRGLGLGVAIVGLIGSAAVLLGFAVGMNLARPELLPGIYAVSLLIPLGMLATYLVIAVSLIRARSEFS
jgi:hypothetical protein